ncbi:MAG: hypothetical protein NT171_04360 [Planctomycetota bacterium]|nr:hypothetical protein [Planctomycetota bacterium]
MLKDNEQLTFDGNKYDFRALVLRTVSDLSVKKGGEAIRSLEEIHCAAGIGENVETYRQACFSLFRSAEFQRIFRALGADLIDQYYAGKGFLQTTPTVRIQLPGADSTSYHCDAWYGHGGSVRSFWMPLTRVSDGNTLYLASDKSSSEQCIAEIGQSMATLRQINEISKRYCHPINAKFGELATFASYMIHGAERNRQDISRVSFDFRIASDENDLGSKSRTNFYSRQELDGSVAAKASESTDKMIGITYSNSCCGASAKSQLLLCTSFAESLGIDVVGNESEIYVFDHLPVLRSHIESSGFKINCVVVFGTDIFEGNKDLAKSVLEAADRSNMAIVFSSESLIYRKGMSKENVIGRLRGKAVA